MQRSLANLTGSCRAFFQTQGTDASAPVPQPKVTAEAHAHVLGYDPEPGARELLVDMPFLVWYILERKSLFSNISGNKVSQCNCFILP